MGEGWVKKDISFPTALVMKFIKNSLKKNLEKFQKQSAWSFNIIANIDRLTDKTGVSKSLWMSTEI